MMKLERNMHTYLLRIWSSRLWAPSMYVHSSREHLPRSSPHDEPHLLPGVHHLAEEFWAVYVHEYAHAPHLEQPRLGLSIIYVYTHAPHLEQPGLGLSIYMCVPMLRIWSSLD